MHLLALVVAASVLSPNDTHRIVSPARTQAVELFACTQARLVKFVGPFGVRQAWPITSALPLDLDVGAGKVLSEAGIVLDGFTQTLHVHATTRSAYVVQYGGEAGIQTIYGPLPVGACNSAYAP